MATEFKNTHIYAEELAAAKVALMAALKWLEGLSSPPQIKMKKDALGRSEVVTDVDVALNRIILGEISRAFPDDVVLGEELSSAPSKTVSDTRFWLVDPLDGTRSFGEGRAGFAIMLALVVDGIPSLGLVHDVAVCETVIAVRGHGVFVETQKGSKKIAGPKACRNRLAFNPYASKRLRAYLFKELGFEKSVDVESTGLRAVQMIKGNARMLVSLPNSAKAWDTAPAKVMLTESGATYTDLDGGPLIYYRESPLHPRGAVATIGMNHEKALACVRSVLATGVHS